jgi:hypothetical protein
MRVWYLVREVCLHSGLLLLGAIWPLMMWFPVLFGGPSFSSLRGEMFWYTTLYSAVPIALGDAILLLLPLPLRIRVWLVVSLSLPLLLISVSYFVRIYVTGR